MVSPTEQAVAGAPLLATKCYVPRWRSRLVSRARLVGRLEQGAERALILVSAPAGFGKTTLLAEWLATSNRFAAWVSLDPSDSDPTLFWSYVVAALQTVRPGIGEQARALLYWPQPPPIESILTTVINELAGSASAEDVTLVLDDYHVVHSQPIHEALAFLIDHLPPRLHLVIASRADPPLPLARLRARGELVELRAPDLRFTPEEAAAFLNEVMEFSLSAGDVAALERRTEGWIAGLQLAALSMQGRSDVSGFVRAFAGDDHYIIDYLLEEVLHRQPERVRSFLLETSVLDRLSAPLCDAVTGRDDARAVLETLERGNLFLVPLDDKRRWYRYHHLFADVLRARLLAERPERLTTLHRRAAAWLEGSGMAGEAIEQALAAHDHATVARLLVANIETFERAGRNASISRWVASLPEAMVRARPRLALIHASAAMETEPNLAAARRLTSWAEEAIDLIEAGDCLDPQDDVDGTVVGPDGLDALKGELLALRLMHSARSLRPDEVARMADEALELLPPGKHQVRGMLHLVRATMQTELSGPETALAHLNAGADEARRMQNPQLLANILEHRGQVSVTLGRLDDGRRSLEEALSIWEAITAEGHWVVCGAHAWLAAVLLEQDDLAGALRQVARIVELAGAAPMRSPVLYGRTIAAQVLLAAGDAGSALEQLHEAEQFARGVSTFRFASYLASVKLILHCRMGDLDAAAAVVRERGLSPETAVDDANEEEMTAYARYLIARGAAGDAARVLARVLPVVRGSGRVQHEIHALTLLALAHDLSGSSPLALESLGRATKLAEPGGFNRTFTGEGPVLTGLVAALANAVRRGSGPAEAGSPVYLTFLLRETTNGAGPGAAGIAAGALPEPLTARELEVLRQIAAGLRNEEIADRLFISRSTVKRHIANAYGKLGVGHRTEAVARANELNLL